MRVYEGYYKSPLGWLSVIATEDTILQIKFRRSVKNHKVLYKTPLLKETYRQLDEYFSKKRKRLALPFTMMGTEFQKKVWKSLSDIPYGGTVSYADIAKAIHKPRAVRAVGSALGKNKLPLIIPCHRVIKRNKKIGGFSSGTSVKKYLLELEGTPITKSHA